jgi:anti-anti-sigma factor
MDFKLSTAILDDVGALMIAVEGELDLSAAQRLAELLSVNGGCPVVLDLSGCRSVDSIGLRFVLRANRGRAEAGKTIALVTPNLSPTELLSLTAIDLGVPVFTGRDQAIAWLGANGAKAADTEPPLLPHTGGPHSSSGL